MTTFAAFQEIIRDLCRNHKALAHESGGTAFIPMGVNDESPAPIPDIKTLYVKLAGLGISGRQQTELNWDAQIRVIQHISDAQDQDQVELARDISLRVAMDIDARLRWEWNDRDEDSRCYFMASISEPAFSPIGLVDDSGVGWEMAIRFTTDRPGYDATKWLA